MSEPYDAGLFMMLGATYEARGGPDAPEAAAACYHRVLELGGAPFNKQAERALARLGAAP